MLGLQGQATTACTAQTAAERHGHSTHACAGAEGTCSCACVRACVRACNDDPEF